MSFCLNCPSPIFSHRIAILSPLPDLTDLLSSLPNYLHYTNSALRPPLRRNKQYAAPHRDTRNGLSNALPGLKQ